MSGCERGRRTRCERGTEIHLTNRATTTPTSTSSTNQHQQNHQHQHEDHHHHHQHRHQQHQYYDHPSTTISTNRKRPGQPAPASLAAVPPPAPAPHAGICSVHVSQYVCARFENLYLVTYCKTKKMLARRFLYLYIVWNGPLVPYTAHKQTCIYKQITRMQALENWKWKRNKVLRTTLIWYMNYKIICNKSPNYCGHADWYDFPPSDAT